MTTQTTIIRPSKLHKIIFHRFLPVMAGLETRQGDVALLVNVLVLVQALQDISQMITISERI